MTRPTPATPAHPRRAAAWFIQVMEPAIIARFGSDVFDIVNRDGKALHEKRWMKKEANSERSDSPERESGRRLNKPGHD